MPATAKKKLGRPPMSEDSRKSRPVAVRLTPEDYDKMAEIARETGIDPSVIARAVVRNYLNQPWPLLAIHEPAAPSRAVITDVPVTAPRRPGPAHATSERASKAPLPKTTASSTALKAVK